MHTHQGSLAPGASTSCEMAVHGVERLSIDVIVRLKMH